MQKPPAHDRILILADDLTGTLDAVAALVTEGMRPRILFSPNEGERLPTDAVSLAINTRSRHIPPEQARTRIRQLTQAGLAAGYTIVFKKTDSTLRGNVGPELAGVLDAAPQGTPLIFSPAFPEAGRTLEQGIMRLHGIEIARSSVASDPLAPVTESVVRKILGTALAESANHTARLPKPSDSQWHASLGEGCHTVDGKSAEDLLAVAKALTGSDRRPLLLAGSAGLGKHLPLIGHLPEPTLKPGLPAGPALILQGSITPRSLAQAARFRSKGTLAIEVGPDWLWSEPRQRTRIENPWWMQIGAAFDQGESVLLHTTSLGIGPAAAGDFQRWNRTPADFSREAPDALGTIGRRILELTGYRTLVLAGGETSQAALDKLGCAEGTAGGEVEIGVNRMQVQAFGRTLEILTKSGGMGSESLYEHFLK